MHHAQDEPRVRRLVQMAGAWHRRYDDMLLRSAPQKCDNFSRTLHKFALKCFPLEKTRKTVKLLRKWFHTSLMQMTASHASLLEVMLRVDAHSAAVGLKHYVLRDHRADAKLAEILVMAVLGPTVPWSAHVERDPMSAVSKGYTNTPWKDTMLEHTLPREIADEDDEAKLDSWDGAGVFDIKHAVTPIPDAEASDFSSKGPTAPGSTRDKRKYSFDGTHFTMHDSNPHLVSHPPVVQMRHLTLRCRGCTFRWLF